MPSEASLRVRKVRSDSRLLCIVICLMQVMTDNLLRCGQVCILLLLVPMLFILFKNQLVGLRKRRPGWTCFFEISIDHVGSVSQFRPGMKQLDLQSLKFVGLSVYLCKSVLKHGGF